MAVLIARLSSVNLCQARGSELILHPKEIAEKFKKQNKVNVMKEGMSDNNSETETMEEGRYVGSSDSRGVGGVEGSGHSFVGAARRQASTEVETAD